MPGLLGDIQNIIPKDLSNKNLGQIGITFKKSREKLNFLGSILESIFSIYEVSTKTLIAFWEILFGKRRPMERRALSAAPAAFNQGRCREGLKFVFCQNC